MFRYAKSIAASLMIAAVGFGARYGQHWIFRDVEELQPTAANVVMLDGGTPATSSCRGQLSGDQVRWRVAVVTNRNDVAPVRSSATAGLSGTLTNTSRMPATLAQQAQDMLYRTANTTFGFADVDLPLIRTRGACSLAEDDPDRIVVNPWAGRAEVDFYTQLRQSLATCESQSILVVVHGFNVTLDAAIARAAQVAEDVPFSGVVIAFSWQSTGRTEAYLRDEALAERHFWSLAQLLANLRRQTNSTCRLHLLAHSMGNRVALRALNALAGTIGPTGSDVDPFLLARLEKHGRRNQPARPVVPDNGARWLSTRRRGVLDGMDSIPERFPEWGSWRKTALAETQPLASLILAAPDVETFEFTQFVRNVQHLSRRIVLYASDFDLALEASRKVHGGAFRAGDSRAQIDVDGLEVVRVTGVSRQDRLGHSYYGSDPRVLDQLRTLMRPPVNTAMRIDQWRR